MQKKSNKATKKWCKTEQRKNNSAKENDEK